MFSQMNIVKNKMRNRLASETTKAILSIRAGLKRQGNQCVSSGLVMNKTTSTFLKSVVLRPSGFTSEEEFLLLESGAESELALVDRFFI